MSLSAGVKGINRNIKKKKTIVFMALLRYVLAYYNLVFIANLWPFLSSNLHVIADFSPSGVSKFQVVISEDLKKQS